LIKLYDEGLIAAHLDNAISSLDDYPSTQRWAKTFHDHPVKADGIGYMSRFLGARSRSLNDRAHQSRPARARRCWITPISLRYSICSASRLSRRNV
jgi:hypothetical protein